MRALRNMMRRKPLGVASALLILLLVCTAIFADVLAPYDPFLTRPETRLLPPSWQHPFGTDDIGRDVFSRIVYGARLSLWVGLLAVGIGTVSGTLIGLICGYWEGRVDLVLQRFMDALQTIPGLILALAIVSVLKPNTTNAMLAIAVVIIPGNSRIVRGAVLSAKQNPYVEAARALGCGHLRIIAKPYSPERHRAHFNHRLHLAGECHFHRSLAELFRPGDTAAGTVLGVDAQQYRAGLYGAGPLARHLSRSGYQSGCPGLQSLWRYAARYLGSQAARTELKTSLAT